MEAYYPDPDARVPPVAPADVVVTGTPVCAREPAYLGATTGHESRVFACARCGHVGPSEIARVRGAASAFVMIVTFGLSACVCPNEAADTYHHCANCDAVLARAALA